MMMMLKKKALKKASAWLGCKVTEPEIMSVRSKGIENILYNISDGNPFQKGSVDMNITSLNEAVFQSGILPGAQWFFKQKVLS